MCLHFFLLVHSSKGLPRSLWCLRVAEGLLCRHRVAVTSSERGSGGGREYLHGTDLLILFPGTSLWGSSGDQAVPSTNNAQEVTLGPKEMQTPSQGFQRSLGLDLNFSLSSWASLSPPTLEPRPSSSSRNIATFSLLTAFSKRHFSHLEYPIPVAPSFKSQQQFHL